MAGPFKSTFFFSCVTGQGWSETWYDIASSDVVAAYQKAGTLAGPRGGMCGIGTSLVGWRSTDLSNPRLTQSSDFETGTQINYKSTSDNPVNSVLARARVQPNRGTRSVWLRGCPDSWTQLNPSNGTYELVGSMISQFTPFQTAIIKGNWCLRTVASAKSSGNISVISAVAPNAVTGLANLTVMAGGTWTSGQNAIVSGFRFPLQHLNGTYPYPGGYSYSGGVVTLTNRVVGLVQCLGYNQTGQIRLQSLAYQPVTYLTLVRPGDRKVGKVLGLPRGRRSAK